MADNIYDTDPVIIWTSIRPWVASNISCWDILCDKGKWADYPSVSMSHKHNHENAFANKIQVMLEQLKDAIIEMERLLKNCCLPILQKNNNEVFDEETSSALPVDKEINKTNFKEPIIRIDPFLRKILASTISVDTANEKYTKEKLRGRDIFENELQVKRIPPQYSSIFFPENKMVENDSIEELKFSVKIENEEVTSNVQLSSNDSLRQPDSELDTEFVSGSNEKNGSISYEHPQSNKCDIEMTIKPKTENRRKYSKRGTKEDRRKCPRCTTVLSTPNLMLEHLKSKRCPGFPVPPKEHVIDGKTPNRFYYCLNKKCSLPNGDKNPDVRFSHCGAYLRHVMDIHATPENCILKCPHCPAAFPLYLNYSHHIREHNLRYTCETCGKTFSDRTTGLAHEKIHTGEKHLLCPQCPYRTNNRTSLQNHIKRHDPEKYRKHKCRVCNKGFIEKAKWRAHELTHTDAKPFVCELCGRKLRSLNNYNLHMMTLHGRKHTCDICGNDYPRLLGLAQHKRDAHGVSDGIV